MTISETWEALFRPAMEPKDRILVANRHGVVDEEADAVRQWLEA